MLSMMYIFAETTAVAGQGAAERDDWWQPTVEHSQLSANLQGGAGTGEGRGGEGGEGKGHH